jgi:hypothetical protein
MILPGAVMLASPPDNLHHPRARACAASSQPRGRRATRSLAGCRRERACRVVFSRPGEHPQLAAAPLKSPQVHERHIARALRVLCAQPFPVYPRARVVRLSACGAGLRREPTRARSRGVLRARRERIRDEALAPRLVVLPRAGDAPPANAPPHRVRAWKLATERAAARSRRTVIGVQQVRGSRGGCAYPRIGTSERVLAAVCGRGGQTHVERPFGGRDGR